MFQKKLCSRFDIMNEFVQYFYTKKERGERGPLSEPASFQLGVSEKAQKLCKDFINWHFCQW